MSVESTPQSDAGEEQAGPTPPAPPETSSSPAPARPTWNTVAPMAPWCPEEWRAHLEAVAPGLAAAGEAAAQHEATGASLHDAPWTLIAASRRGRLHAHRGDHREDATHLVHFAHGWCTAVADGAGSATYSRLGSAIATYTVTHALREALQHGAAATTALGPALRHAAQAANDAQREFAARTGLALRELRTTLLVAALHHDLLGVMQVGDGAMALLHADSTVTHPHAAATGDYSGEVAHFLPDDGALDVLQSSLRTLPAAGVCGVLLASDGVDDPWYPFTKWARPLLHALVHGHSEGDTGAASTAPAAFVPAWSASVVHAADPVHALTEWLAFEKRGENDDRTLCVAFTPAIDTAVRVSVTPA